MLKHYDSSHNFIQYISNYKDYCIESDLNTADKTLTFTYLGKCSDIPNESYIETEDDIFVVKEIHPDENGTSYTCQLDLEDFERSIIPLFQAENVPMLETAQAALADSGWSVQTNITRERSVRVYYKTPRAILEKLRDAWMCEIRYDTKTKTVYFEDEFGDDKGVYFIPGLNLGKPDVTLDSYEYYTRIRPSGADGLTIKSVNDGVDYLENYQYSNKVKTLYWEDTNYTDAQALKDDAEKYLEDLSKPKRSYSAEVTDLAKCRQGGDYDNFEFELGDTIHLIYEMYGINEKQRIVKMKLYPDEPGRNSVELSNTAITFEELQDRLNKAADAWETLSNSDGSIKGIYVHGVQVDDVVGIVVEINTQIDNNQTVQDAVSVANGAASTASDASLAAQTASQAASTALTNANSAVAAASEAWNKADSAQTAAANAGISASTAQQAATAAGQAATAAGQAATAAGQAASSAQSSANSAINGLLMVEDVLGTLTWISTHGEYIKTSDTVIVAGKVYYTLVGTAVVSPSIDDIGTYYELSNGEYIKTSDTAIVSGKTYYTVDGTPVGTPSAADIGTYYELNVDDAMSQFIQSHLALTNAGLYVFSTKNGWRVLVANDGVYIINPDGIVVAKYKGTVTIGQDDKSHVQIDAHNLMMFYGSSAIPYMLVGDSQGTDDGAGTEEMFSSEQTSSGQSFTVKNEPVSVVSVTCNGYEVSPSNYTRNGKVFTFPIFPPPEVYSEGELDEETGEEVETGFEYGTIFFVTIKYKTNETAPTYTFGTRKQTASVGIGSVAEGKNIEASGYLSHAEGDSTKATASRSHAEGYYTTASGDSSHAEGDYSRATGLSSHAEGGSTRATGTYAHAEGMDSTASGLSAHAQNEGTIAASRAQTAMGKYNEEDDADEFAMIIGNGSDVDHRSNALTLDWNGNMEIAGDLKINGSESISEALDGATKYLPDESKSPAAVNVQSGTWTNLCSFTGEANATYMILYGAAFTTNANGYRQLHIAGTSSSAGRYSPSYAAVSGEQTRIQASIVYKFTAAGTIYLWARQNSGSQLATYGWMEVIKLSK